MKHTKHVVLNALLLSGSQSFRRAGIHHYIYNTLRYLPLFDNRYTYTAFVNQDVVDVPAGVEALSPRWDTIRPSKRVLWEQTLARRSLHSLKPDLYHSMAYALPVLDSTPSLVTVYDLSFFREPERLTRLRRSYLQGMVRYAVRKADRVLAISEAGKHELIDVLNVQPDKIDVAYPGISEQYRLLSEEQKLAFRARIQPPKRYILHVGTIEPRKNLSTLLKAYAQLSSELQQAVKLVLIGGRGWQTEPIFALIEQLGLKDNIILPGYIPDADLPFWYNCADLLAYPSVYEGFGIPIIEALACGLPVIASDTSSLPEAAGPHSLLLPAQDVSIWSAELTDLLDDMQRQQQMAQSGLDYVRQFTWQNTAQETFNSYQRILG